MASRRLLDMDSRVSSQAFNIFAKAAAAGLDVHPICTYRSSAEQDADYAKGRTAPGPIVTHAKGGESYHNFVGQDGSPASLAIDYAIFENGRYITDGSDPRYEQFARLAMEADPRVRYGGDWPEGKKDADHIEWHLA